MIKKIFPLIFLSYCSDLSSAETNKINISDDSAIAEALQIIELETSDSFQELDLNIKDRLCANYLQLCSSSTPSHQEILKIFQEIQNEIKSKQNVSNLNVHIFDAYIFGTTKRIRDLNQLGNLLEPNTKHLTLAQVGNDMKSFLAKYPQLFTSFQYHAGQIIPATQINQYLTQHFTNMDKEVSTLCPESAPIWSKAWSLAKTIYDEEGDPSPVIILFDQVCESYQTQGGCIQGRINRGFIGYLSVLSSCGL